MSQAAHQVNRIDAGKVEFADAHAAALLADSAGVLNDPAAAGWECVKQNSSRTVWRGTIGQQEVYVKHFHSQRLAHRVLQVLGMCDAKREMQFATHLTNCGVPTAKPLAVKFGRRRQWICTAAVEQALPANQWHLQKSQQASAHTQVAQATVTLAGMIARMHNAGVIHCDLHCGNVLVAPGKSGPQLVLMDLHRMRRRRQLSRRAMAANLAQLMHDRMDFTTRTQRLRFLKHYLVRLGGSGSLRGWQSLIEQFAHAHTARQYAGRDRRLVGDDRYFTRLRLGGGWRGRAILATKEHPTGSQAAATRLQAADWQKALADPKSLLQDVGDKLKDCAGKSIVRRRLQVGQAQLDVLVCRYHRRQWWKRLVDCFRSSRARRAFNVGHELLIRRIATTLPLACLERRIGPVLLENILIVEAVDSPRLQPFLEAYLSGTPQSGHNMDLAQQRHLAQILLWQMGRLLQRMHDTGYSHRGMGAHNLLVRYVSPTPQLVLADLDGVRRPRWLTQRRRYQSLMRLNVSLLACPAVTHAGRLRMLLGYLRRPGSGRINFKPYWRTLEAWSQRKLRQQIRSRQRRQRNIKRSAQ